MTRRHILTWMLAVLAALSRLNHAHMQMSWPNPIDSPVDPQTAEADRDYSYTSPLLEDGSNYPCKGYQTTSPEANRVTATFVAGQTYNMSLAGGATHSGGSCQLSLSYDNGATFHVIESMIGGCPVTTTYDFTIPGFAPASSSVLFAWTWFNLIGNREMYMNCARVAITTPPAGRHRRTRVRRQNSIQDLPHLFVCNVPQSTCETEPSTQVVFPQPGNNVIYGNDLVPVAPGPGYTGDPTPPGGHAAAAIPPTTVGPFSNTTNSSSFVPSSLPTSSMTTTTTTTLLTSFISSPVTTSLTSSCSALSTSTFLTASTTPRVTVSYSTLTPIALATALAGPCTPGQFTCNSPTSFSDCLNGASGSTSYLFMGDVAAGMTCSNGVISRTNDGPCTPNGRLFCDGDDTFYLCNQGGLINMGSVAAGTICSNGRIVGGSR